MDFYPDNPEKFIPKSSRYRCPHCGENSFQKELIRVKFPKTYLGRTGYKKRFKCGFCNKYSYRINKENKKQPMVITVISSVLCIAIIFAKEHLFYKSGLGVHPFSHQPFDLKYVLAWAFVISIISATYYIINKFKLANWCAWQTSFDGTPAEGRRIKVKFVDEPHFEKVIKQWAIYDIEPVGKSGLIYAQCEQVFCNAATLRIIKCKNYNAPTGDEIKIIDGKKSVIGTIYEETEPPTNLENDL